VARILFVHPVDPSFIRIDRDALAARWEVESLHQPGRVPKLWRGIRGVLRADVVVGWWASWHTFVPFTFAWLIRRPSVLIVGGFDTASVPDIGYGFQRGGPQRLLSRWVMRRARVLVTNSESSRAEIARNISPELAARVVVIHHGVPDRFGSSLAAGAGRDPRGRVALSVGVVARSNLERKGHRAFVATAAEAELGDVEFVLAGKWADDAIDELRAIAGPNVRFTGWVEDAELDALYGSAAVYVQPSAHEGFGLSVAEGMLAGCVPVVSDRGSLPEVVGDTGVVVAGLGAAETAEGVRRGLELAAAGPGAGARARDRVLTEFPLSKRVEALQAVVAGVLGEGGG
jgi:glycosyltransferase involved in cell wall biosynthesis